MTVLTPGRVLLAVLLVIVTLGLTYSRLPTWKQEREVAAPDRSSKRTAAIDWDKRFWFVPNDVRNCSEMRQRQLELPASVKLAYEEFDRTVQRHAQNELEGYTSKIADAIRIYLELASHPSVKTICETGFNAGHSTFGWLTINPRAKVYSFDIGRHAYSKPMAQHIRRLYPGRFNITWGDSRKTLPEFRRQHVDVLCDLVIIDGGHTTDICKSDLLNFKKMANSDTVVILDNYPQKSAKFVKILGDVWEWAKRNGVISEIFRCHVDRKPHDFGFSVGRYINNTM